MGASTSRPAPTRQGPPPENGVRVTAGLLQRVVDQTHGASEGKRQSGGDGASTSASSAASPSSNQEQQRQKQQQQRQQQQQQHQRFQHGSTRMFGVPDLR